MLRPRAFDFTILALGLCGAVCCGLLLEIHARGDARGWLGSVCGGERGNCARAVQGRWGTLPPRERSPGRATESRESEGLPVAALGLFHFSFLAIWFGVIGARGGGGRLGAALVVIGALGSAIYLSVMAFVTRTWCPLCLASHVCSFLVLGVLLLSLVPRPETPVNERAAPRASRPSPRLSFVALLLVVAVCAAEWNAFRAAELGPVAEFAARLRNDGAYLDATYFGQVKYALDPARRGRNRDHPAATLNVRFDDPMILPEAAGYCHTLVVFSDVECPSCARFDRLVDEEIRPLYAGHLRIVYKHNPRPRLHSNALTGARALEAARLQGRFWEMRDIVRENRRSLAEFDYDAAAARLGLNVERFLRDMSSEAVRDRIDEDRRTAAALGSTTTPDVFLGGRRVKPEIRHLIAFWRTRAGALKTLRLDENQGWGGTRSAPRRKEDS